MLSGRIPGYLNVCVNTLGMQWVGCLTRLKGPDGLHRITRKRYPRHYSSISVLFGLTPLVTYVLESFLSPKQRHSYHFISSYSSSLFRHRLEE